MNSPLDQVDEQTTADSTSEIERPSEEVVVDEQPISEEEEAPRRNAEGRINELLARNKELERKLDMVVDRMAPPPPPPPMSTASPEVQKAIEYLRELGFTHKDDLSRELQALKDQEVLNSEHFRLASGYDGSDGRPKYDKNEVEDYMRQSGVYNPEAAYKLLHEPELTDWALKKAESTRKQRPYVERANSSALNRDDNTITRDVIAEWMKTPEGRMKYEKNREKILKLMQQGAL